VRAQGRRVVRITPEEFERLIVQHGWCSIGEARKLIAKKRLTAKSN
jgi:hypothetical protein